MTTRNRISKDEYYYNIALEVAKRGTCIRRVYGAVIVNNDQIISTGYCGAPRGVTNCNDVGKCLREELGIPSGERYEACKSVHAEQNAILHASRERAIGATMYVAGFQVKGEVPDPAINTKPCKLCQRFIINAGIEHVIYTMLDAIPAYLLYLTTLNSGALLVKADVVDWINILNEGKEI